LITHNPLPFSTDPIGSVFVLYLKGEDSRALKALWHDTGKNRQSPNRPFSENGFIKITVLKYRLNFNGFPSLSLHQNIERPKGNLP